MRVSLLRYIVFFPGLPACPGALKSERPPLPSQEAAFLGGPELGEPEPERRRQTKQKLRRTQGAGIWPEAVPRTEGRIRIMTFLDASLQASSEQTTTMIDQKNRLPIRNAPGIELVGTRETDELGQPRRREVGGCLPLRVRTHLDQWNLGAVRNRPEGLELSAPVLRITLAL